MDVVSIVVVLPLSVVAGRVEVEVVSGSSSDPISDAVVSGGAVLVDVVSIVVVAASEGVVSGGADVDEVAVSPSSESGVPTNACRVVEVEVVSAGSDVVEKVTALVVDVDVVVEGASISTESPLVLVVAVVVDGPNAPGISPETSQYPPHWKLDASSASMVMSSQLVALTHDTAQGPSPQENSTFPLHASLPSQSRETEEESEASMLVSPAHALLPMQLIWQRVASLHDMSWRSLQLSSPMQLSVHS